jgi:hypothetical protein
MAEEAAEDLALSEQNSSQGTITPFANSPEEDQHLS